ncbi:MAG: hypothetical protein ABWZ98_10955 [Nakamurella sp.]
MTITESRPALWTSMPGWGIAADLTPPELIQARRLGVLRRLMAAGIAGLLLIGAGGYYLARAENASASTDLATVQQRTAQLLELGQSYSAVVQIQGTIVQVEAHIAQVMGADVDLSALMGDLESTLPETMTIDRESVTISTAGVADAADPAAENSAADSGLDTSGLSRIGSITISGTGQTLDDLSDYIDRLHTITGLVDVLPVSNSISSTNESGTEFSLTAGLTDALLTHRFDVGG